MKFYRTRATESLTDPYIEGETVIMCTPCPYYDREGIKSWLSDMAEEGLYLKKNGFFLGLSFFEYKKKKNVKYHLAVADWLNKGPDSETLEIMSRQSWTYLTKRGGFHVYRSSDPNAPELDDESSKEKYEDKVQIEFEVFWWLFVLWIVFMGSLTGGRFGLLLPVEEPENAQALVIALMLLLNVIFRIPAMVSLHMHEEFGEEGDWRRKAVRHYLFSAFKALCWVLIAGIFIVSLINMIDKGISTAEYSGGIPFFTKRL